MKNHPQTALRSSSATLSPVFRGFSAFLIATTLLLAGCGNDPPADKVTADAGTDAGGSAAVDGQSADAGSVDSDSQSADTGPACAANTCAIAVATGVTCAAAGTGPDACRRCDPSKSTTAWTTAAGATCDDGDACTEADACDLKAVCVGKAKACSDKNPCTADSCKAGSCIYDFTSATCDDNDPCTGDGNCVSGKCGPGLPKKCDDSDPCTTDSCVAATGACASALNPKACDDGNACTGDSCDSKTGCKQVGLATGASCTTNPGCTRQQKCTATGSCTGGAPVDCDDNNPCTSDSCKTNVGCINKFNDGSCTDGEACTSGDSCSGGVCLGQKTASCKACSKTFGATAAQLIKFAIGTDGEPSNGLDVDGDPKTCAPKSSCSQGVDNAFASLAFVLNPALDSAVKTGALQFVADFDGFSGPGKFFKMHLYYANLTQQSQAASCTPATQPCSWLVSQQAFTGKCKPRVTFDDAKLVGNKLTAGGAGTVFAMEVKLAGGDATFLVKGARLEGTLTLAADGKTVIKFSGVIGGSMTEKAILSTFQGLPDAAFQPLTKAGAMILVQNLLVLDIDADGDGTPESTSVGLRIEALGATLAGMAKK